MTSSAGTEPALGGLRRGTRAAESGVVVSGADAVGFCVGRRRAAGRASMTDEDVVAQHRLGAEGIGGDELGRAERAGLQEHSAFAYPEGLAVTRRRGSSRILLLSAGARASSVAEFELEPGSSGGVPNQAPAPATDTW